MKTLSVAWVSFCMSLSSLPAQGLGDDVSDRVPVYRVTVIGRTTKAVNYQHRGGPTKIDFRGTVLLPEARGEAVVESKRGAMEIDARLERLDPPSRFGLNYLTYVLWAITPDGRATNLGELVANASDKSKIHVTTELQAFALIVTAEPYFAVTQPSDVVVLENVIRKDTVGKIQVLDAKYELLPRGHYTLDTGATSPQTAGAGKKVSLNQYEAILELYQARNAVQLARVAGADRHAAETFRKAEELLRQAEEYHAGKAANKTIVMTAREAAQTAEDARLIATRRLERERVAELQKARVP